MYKLYLDDLRPIPEGFVGVRTYNTFMDYITTNGLPNFVSFDHDLGEEKNGYDCARWLVNYCHEKQLSLPKYAVHSMNPVGRENILAPMEINPIKKIAQ